jgi:hypothetical protein
VIKLDLAFNPRTAVEPFYLKEPAVTTPPKRTFNGGAVTGVLLGVLAFHAARCSANAPIVRQNVSRANSRP